jgi:hypothetical protein
MGGKRHILKDAQELAESRNGKCLSIEYITYDTKMEWICEDGHIWNATFGSVYKGSWCPTCAGCKRLTLQDAKDLAKSKGGDCISEEYINAILIKKISIKGLEAIKSQNLLTSKSQKKLLKIKEIF